MWEIKVVETEDCGWKMVFFCEGGVEEGDEEGFSCALGGCQAND